MNVQAWTYLIVTATFALYIGIAWWSRVASTSGFYVAGRGVPAVANGMATGADWMSAASFISMAGLISFMGYTGTIYLMGWTGGYVLLALLLAPYLRKYGKFTTSEFVGDRYYSDAARLVAAGCTIFVSFTYIAGQMRGVGVVFSRFLEVEVHWGVVIGVVIVFFYAVLGGMKGITYTQVAQYCVLIVAFLIPAAAISWKITGNPHPAVRFRRVGPGRAAGGRLPARGAGCPAPRAPPAGIHRRLRSRQEEHDRRDRDHARADGGNRGSAARAGSLLHRAQRQGRPLERTLGARLHRAPLHHGARGRRLRPRET